MNEQLNHAPHTEPNYLGRIYFYDDCGREFYVDADGRRHYTCDEG